MAHRRAKLTVAGRELVVRRIVEGGWPAVRVAEAMGIREQPRTSGWLDSGRKASRGWKIAARARVDRPSG
jgi:hypothetical protein